MRDFRQNLISPGVTARQALRKLEELQGPKTLFIANAVGKLLGSLTDGDIRRGVLDGKQLDEPVTDFMFSDFVFLREKEFTLDDLDRCRSWNAKLLPLVNKLNQVIEIFDLEKQKSVLPVTALIMAGGRGERLAPLTRNTPKPLLKVGDKPMLEHQIRYLKSYGIDTIYLAVNYLKDQIKAYFGNGSAWGVSIQYLDEEQPLGTIGAAQHLPDTVAEDLLILNADILTTIDLENFYRTFWTHNAAMTIATVPYHVSVPYAVVEVKHAEVVSLTEKPAFTYQANAGIYLLKREHVTIIPSEQSFDATDLVRQLIGQKKRVTSFMLLNYWLDIGSPADYQKAQEDIRFLKM